MTIKLDFCKLVFYNNYVICNINEGETLNIEKSNELTKTILDHFKHKPFVYITHRIYSYSVDPNIYHITSKIDTLAGFVVVSDKISTIKNALFEKEFLKKPFEIFSDIDDAIHWANEICVLQK